MTVQQLPHAARGGAAGVIVALLEQRTGQQLDIGRNWRIDSTLQPLLRERSLGSIDELVARMVVDADPGLADAVVDALLNQETSFFRDAAVIELVAQAAANMAQEAGDRRLRIWSAACSTGQEPLSLAMLFTERHLQTGMSIPEIRATDLSARVLARARAGRYTQFEIQRGLPIRRMVQWFDARDDMWEAKAELRYRILYAVHNLIADPLPPGRFDIVLCRNVLLYLSPDMRRLVLDRLATALRPGGLLVLGAGETVIGQTDALVPSERYRGLYRPA
ncbi:CheR family methyltransferase [Sphingomonas sp. CFBP 13720]|uniref:CheR family methyltransferase n=1 Tax=Sphingomonas sp. CFBP 13720 TaxID=2775302 RepID=UPI00177AEE1B|nr:protein-glutamate O-methyltransferase CheR [Sphingomonas sp. CFBP 13720]MBD8677108.1 protein-glutamate O-methyltransferase CheR [Sphingomonas sp. CFBP 13720]